MGQVTVRRLLLAVAVLLLLGACAAGTNPAVNSSGAGFWQGLWQGFIIPVTFVISLFNDHVNIYEVQNNGNWYDFGFVLGLTFPYGAAGGGAARRR